MTGLVEVIRSVTGRPRMCWFDSISASTSLLGLNHCLYPR